MRLSSYTPIDQTRVSGSQDHKSEDDAIPGKGGEVVTGDIAQQPAHAEKGADERSHAADREHRQIGNAEQLPVLVDVIEGGGEHGRDSEEEGKFRCCPSGETEE